MQKMLVAQNRRVDQLVEKIEQQQDKLDKLSVHLQTLQSKVSWGPRGPQEAPERSRTQASLLLLPPQVSHKRQKPHRRRDEEPAGRTAQAQDSPGEDRKTGPAALHTCDLCT